MAIKRIWHGWTTLDNADEYQTLLHNEIFPGIEGASMNGRIDSRKKLKRMSSNIKKVEVRVKTL